MDAAQDARSKLHTFPRHRWKPSAVKDDTNDDWPPKIDHPALWQLLNPHHQQSNRHSLPSLATETTKSCQYEKHQFVSLKSQCDVSPPSSKSKNCLMNRFVHLTHSECFTVKDSATDRCAKSDVHIDTNHKVCRRCCCCSCRRVAAKQCLGCWKWSFHNGTNKVSFLLAAQFLMLFWGALRSALFGRHHSLSFSTKPTMFTELQRMVRSVLPMFLLLNMLPLIYAG